MAARKTRKDPLYEEGLKVRKKVLTAQYVDRQFASASAFTRPMQEMATRAWGLTWARPGLPHRTRSMLNIAFLVALDKLVLLPEALPPDAFAAGQARFGPDGSVIVDGRPLRGPLLMDSYGATSRFRDTRLVERTRLYKLLAPVGTPRLAFYMPGRYYDGWLSLDGAIQLWPERTGAPLAGRLDFELSLPPDGDPVLVRFEQGGKARSFPVRPGQSTAVSLLVCAEGPWNTSFSAPFTGSIGSRFVSVRSTAPVFRAESRACS